MKILTYNIHGLPWCKVNVPAMIDWIFNKSGAEIVCLQEVFSREHKRLFWKKAAQEGWTFLAPPDLIYWGLWPSLANGSGLITILHPRFNLSSQPKFEPYTTVNSTDRFVKKGFFSAYVSDGIHNFQIINTHMQSDITECCTRLNFNNARYLQEEQMYLAMTRNEFSLPLVIGDTNMSSFKYFHRVDQNTHATFPETGEHLDHLLCLPGDAGKVMHVNTVYHDEISLSDHIPVVYTVNLIRKSNRLIR